MGALFIISILIGLTLPNEAFAWAPATHLYYAKEVLYFAHLLPPAIRELLLTYRADFFYGCIAADITIGKAYVEYLYNCHNFDVGLGLLDHAKNPAEEAFVYGYLSHLAADTVSHNFFVPYQNIEHFENRGSFRHAYWEVRLDHYFGERAWLGIDEVIKNPRNHSHDLLLDGALKDTIFSFKTNKVLFSGMLAIQRLRKWQTLIKNINDLSKTKFNAYQLSEYNRLAVSAIILLLTEKKKSAVYRVDPTGKEMITEATEVRAMLKKLEKQKDLNEEVVLAECERFRSHVRKKYFSEYLIGDTNFHPSLHLRV